MKDKTYKNWKTLSAEEKKIVEHHNSGMMRSTIVSLYGITQGQFINIVREAINNTQQQPDK